jgi:putative transposase
MSEKYKTFDTESAYFITFTLVEWLPLFAIPEFANCMVNSLKYCIEHKGLSIFGYCIMPGHIHLIAQSNLKPLGAIIRDLKKYTAASIVLTIKSNDDHQKYLKVFQDEANKTDRNKYVKVWIDGYHPEIIFSNKFFFQKLNYIHSNPVVAGIVTQPEDYYYSSARNYAELDAPLDIIFESQQLISY